MTADISKMYRQILLNTDDKKYHRLFWRSDKNESIKVYEMQTVTFGLASSPYLAVRCLMQLAYDCEKSHPKVSQIIQNNFYMDDLLVSFASAQEMLECQRDLTNILGTAGFQLRKWLCNDPSLLGKFSVDNKLEAGLLEMGQEVQNKTLGVFCAPSGDFIYYKIGEFSISGEFTKRSILSIISQIFDPLGLLGPILIMSKLIIQELWKAGLTWDEPVPDLTKNTFFDLLCEFKYINNIKIPRHAILSEYLTLELHSFNDSSEKAYGACLYLRSISASGKIYSSLICAKSRVAPVKKVNLPRLELMGAVLAANLAQKTCRSLNVVFDKKYFWSDSTIALSWIRGDVSRWREFVANRVSEIQGLTDTSDWVHVKSENNPADLISRGCLPSQLMENKFWWHGPEYLLHDSKDWVIETIKIDFDIPEQKSQTHLILDKTEFLFTDFLLQKYSSFFKILRILAFCFRFVNNLRARINKTSLKKSGLFLLPSELDNAMNFLIKKIQIQCFTQEYHTLQNQAKGVCQENNNIQKIKRLHKYSHILNLNPFYDKSTGLIRVGGRIKQCKLNFDKIHPIVLPKGHILTKLIIQEIHNKLFHAGPQQLLYSVREQFWPISGRNVCKFVVKNCITCIKAKPQCPSYLMGDLPGVRLQTLGVFLNVGVDYGGPYFLKDRKTRNPKKIKAYLCLFVCMSTKACHLECVTDLTTVAFMATLKRFIARRGKPANIYSDNGTNFLGASNQLSELYSFIDKNSNLIGSQLSKDRVCWHFIPARAPNHGGLWEAGIKSAKFNIKRVCGDNFYTYEDFSTILAQIESILNSRPLSPLSSDPEDLTPLTPGHFIIGRSLTALPEPNLLEVPENRLDRFLRIQSAIQHFWTRWQKEYLSELQTRCKWKEQQAEQAKVGALVLVKQDNAAVMFWQLGRITAVFPGRDNITRVVEVKVHDGLFKRPLSIICVLSVE